jgi:hypothetical protein
MDITDIICLHIFVRIRMQIRIVSTGYGTIGHRHHKYVIEYSDMDMISDVEYLDSDTDRSKRL